MKKRVTALALAAGLGVPLIAGSAAAAAPTDLYVNNAANAGCSDAGTGTQIQPYCTLGAATAAVTAGQTVHVAGTYSERLVINRSGTPGSPITFTSAAVWTLTGASPGIEISGQHDIVVRYARITGTRSGPGIAVADSTRISLDHLAVYGGTDQTTPPGIQLSGVSESSITKATVTGPMSAGIELDATTSRVTVQAAAVASTTEAPDDGIAVAGPDNMLIGNRVLSARDAGIRISAGADRNVVANNLVMIGFGRGIHNAGARDTAITNNTVEDNCDTDIRVDGSSSGVSVQNNVVTNGGSRATPCPEPTVYPSQIGVYDGAVTDTVVDYNLVRNPKTDGQEYAWNGPMSLQDFRVVSGQAVHDIDTNSSNSEILGRDSANSAAPGWQSIDYQNRIRVDDPKTPNTGAGPVTYADRGYAETYGPPIAQLAITAVVSGGQGQVRADASKSVAWAPLPISTYIFDFGDGTVVTQSTAIAQHRYADISKRYLIQLAVLDPVRVYSGTATVSDWTYVRPARTPTRSGTSARRARG